LKPARVIPKLTRKTTFLTFIRLISLINLISLTAIKKLIDSPTSKDSIHPIITHFHWKSFHFKTSKTCR